MKAQNEQNEARERLSGTVVWWIENAGSKSEAALPHLYVGRETPPVVLMKEGDNPFENNSLQPYDGRRVTVVGERNANGVLIVESVETEKMSTTDNEENEK